jgi:glycosyltransferase involved in cell wall biosynthesis
MEIIVADDGSTDHSQNLIEKNYKNVQFVSQQHQGVSAARNRGIKQARGNWIALLDSDDAWKPEKLELQVQALAENIAFKVIHTNETWIRNGKGLSQMKKHRKYGGNIFKHCLPLCVISPSSVMIHQDIFDKVGYFDESLPVCEDYDYWLRMCCQFPVLFLDQALIIKYGGHEDQLSTKYWGMDRFRIQALVNILNTDYLIETDRRVAVEILLKKIDIYLKGARKRNNMLFVDEFQSIQERYDNEFTKGSLRLDE